MARTTNPGITFYRVDSGHIRNEKVRLLLNEFDSDGYYIWSCLLDYGYFKYGYYFDMNDADRLELFASEYCRKKLSQVKEVISGCLRRGLFDRRVAELSGVLTCKMMQEVFMYATYDRRKKGVVFQMQEDWLLIDLEMYKSDGIELIPGKKGDSSREERGFLPGRKRQTETETETETETKNSFSPAAAPSGAPKKKKKLKKESPPEPYWELLVACWFNFNEEKFGDKPSFEGADPRHLKKIVQRLKKRAAEKQIVWTEETAIRWFRYFLDKSFADDWLRQNFLLSNLEKQFDKFILNQSNGANRKNNFSNGSSGSVPAKSAGATKLLGLLKDEVAADPGFR